MLVVLPPGSKRTKYYFHSSGEGDAPQNKAEIVFVLLPLQSYLDGLLYYQINVCVTHLVYIIKYCLIWICVQIKVNCFITVFIFRRTEFLLVWMIQFILCSMSENEGRFVRWSFTTSEMEGVFGTSHHWIWLLKALSKLGLANTQVHGCDLRAFVYSGGLLVMTDWWAGILNSTDWVITRKCSEQALIGPRLRNFGSDWLGKASWVILHCEVVIRLTRAASNTWSSVKWHACARMYFGFVDGQHCYNCYMTIASLILHQPECTCLL